MRFTWSAAKRHLNLQRGLDFVDAPRIFDGPTYTYEDDRFDYSEQRFVTLAGAALAPQAEGAAAALGSAASSRALALSCDPLGSADLKGFARAIPIYSVSPRPAASLS